MKPLTVLSLFDGIGTGFQILKDLNIPVKEYHAFEIDKYAAAIAKYNHPEIIQHGDVTLEAFESNMPTPGKVDLLLAGFPCQDFSQAGFGKGFSGDKGKLFFNLVDMINLYKPKMFLLENVKMKKETLGIINNILGVEPVRINSNLLSAQNRDRYYWLWNIDYMGLPDDLDVLLKDVLEGEAYTGKNKSYCIDHNYYKGTDAKQYIKKSRRQLVFIIQKGRGNNPGGLKATNGKTPTLSSNSWQENNKLLSCKQLYKTNTIKGMDCIKRIYSEHGKCPTLTNMQGGHRQPKINGIKDNKFNWKKSFNIDWNYLLSIQRQTFKFAYKLLCMVFLDILHHRRLTVVECERLQTLPDNYTAYGDFDGKVKPISNSQRYKAIGNGWTLEVVKYLLKQIKEV